MTLSLPASMTISASMLILSERVAVGYKVSWPRVKVLGWPGSFPFCQTVSANPDKLRREGAAADSEAGISCCIAVVCADKRGAAPIKIATTVARVNQPHAGFAPNASGQDDAVVGVSTP